MTILRSYMVRLLLTAYAVVGLALGALLWLLEMLNRLEDGIQGLQGFLVMAVLSLQSLPEGLIDLLPVITVLATALAMGGLQARNEMTVMRASGLSLWRLTGVAMLPGLMIAFMGLAALQWLTPLIHQGPERMLGASLGENGLWHPSHGLWLRQGEDFLNIQTLHLGRLPTDVNLYRFDTEGGLVEHVSAHSAVILPDGVWRLEQVTIRQQNQPGFRHIEHFETYDWEAFVSARQLELLLSPPARLGVLDLWQYVEGLKQRDQDVAEFEMVLWRRLALPLSCLGMLLAAMATAAVPLKSRTVSVRLVGALTLGLGFQLFAELSSYVGLVMAWPVVPVALMPPILLVVFSWWLLARAR